MTVKPVKKATRSDGFAHGAPMATPRASRMAWLLAHPKIWVGAPSDTQDVDDAGREVLHAVGELMVKAGLYSKRTLKQDRIWAVRVLIGEARKRLS